MKKLLLIMALFCLEQLSAQPFSDHPDKRFALLAGINLANMDFNKGVPAPAVPADAAWKNGFSLGFRLRVPLTDMLSLQPEYYYTQRKGADKSLGISYTTGYLSMPVLLNYEISPRFAVMAGPQAELLINANEKNNGVKTNITHDMEERSLGITAGIEVQLINSFFVSARYLHGLNHIGLGQRSDVKEFKYEVVSVLVGIRF